LCHTFPFSFLFAPKTATLTQRASSDVNLPPSGRAFSKSPHPNSSSDCYLAGSPKSLLDRNRSMSVRPNAPLSAKICSMKMAFSLAAIPTTCDTCDIVENNNNSNNNNNKNNNNNNNKNYNNNNKNKIKKNKNKNKNKNNNNNDHTVNDKDKSDDENSSSIINESSQCIESVVSQAKKKNR
jgi:hypothetical protein